MATPQLFIAFTAEGSTDYRFLKNIILRTVKDIVYKECTKMLDIDDITILSTKKTGLSFEEYIIKATQDAIDSGAHLMIVHSDSDKDTYEERILHKFDPARKAMVASKNTDIQDYEPYLIPIIPIRMIEAWMLADKALLKAEIGTSASDGDLGIDGNPEELGQPKETINHALQIAKKRATRKRKIEVDDISELYSIIGAKLKLPNLARLSSYNKFVDELRRGFKALGYLH